MLKIIVLLAFVVATVTGQAQLPNNGQNGLNQVQLGPPAGQPFVYFDGVPRIARRKPCQKRRRLQTPDGKPLSTGWLPLFHVKSVHPMEQQRIQDINNEQLRPQSLKEGNVVAQENQGNVSETPSRIPVAKVELKSAAPDQNSVLEEVVPDQNKLNDKIEDPLDELCQELEDAEGAIARSDKQINSNQNDKPVSDDVNKQAIKLISKCVQDVKNLAGEEPSGRRSFSGTSSPSMEKPSSSNFDVPVNDDNDDDNRQALESNNDFDASQPNVLRSKPTAFAGDLSPSSSSPYVQEERKNQQELVGELEHPVLRSYVTNISNSQVSLLKNGRVCYACSSASDPSCWQPGRTTTVKYCKKNDDACISKTVKTYDDLIMIRDCGSACNKHDVPKYKSCRICHTDMCNGGVAIDSFNMLLFTFLMAAFKYAL